METKPGGLLPAIGALAGQIGRLTRIWATISSVAALWLWIITGHAATGIWFVATPPWILLLLLLVVPSGILWFFYVSLRSLTDLPAEIRRLADEGRLRSTELAGAFRGQEVGRPRLHRAWAVFRGILELRGLLFRSKSLLLAAGMAVRLRVFNPVVLGVLFLAFVASVGITIAAVLGTLLAPLL